jgi:hypothetical protein
MRASACSGLWNYPRAKTKRGDHLKTASLEEIIDGQLDAYNRGDYELFSSYYDSNIISYDLTTCQPNPKMSGSLFFAHYKQKFMENPKLFCRVTARTCHANWIIDKELISDYRDSDHVELVIYQIDDGLITKMWFTQEISTD